MVQHTVDKLNIGRGITLCPVGGKSYKADVMLSTPPDSDTLKGEDVDIMLCKNLQRINSDDVDLPWPKEEILLKNIDYTSTIFDGERISASHAFIIKSWTQLSLLISLPLYASILLSFISSRNFNCWTALKIKFGNLEKTFLVCLVL